MVQNNKKMADIMLEFISNTILGHESGFYKMLEPNMIQNNDTMIKIVTVTAINYLNFGYKSLIKRNDPYYIEYFDGMSNIKNHSHVCLLQIVMNVLLQIHHRLDRQNLDMTSYDAYINSVKSQLTEMEIKFRPSIIKLISHDCKGKDITQCNPNEDLFLVKK